MCAGQLRVIVAWEFVLERPVMAQAVEMETVEGVVIEGGIVCPLIRLKDGRVFSLQGIGQADAPVGRQLRLAGMEVQMSTCQQGRTFHVSKVLD